MKQFKLSALLSVFVQTVLLLCLTLVSVQSAFAQNDIRVTYIHTDADGTPFAATDEQGNVEWQIEHQPYGKEYSNTEVRRESTLSFAGKAYDEEIGLSYFGGRWYSPELGRFMGIDPVGVNPEDWKTFNRYSYGFNNPYKYVDPDGNLAFLVPIAIFLAKEGLAEVASRATGGATDFLSVRRLGSKVVKKSLGALKRNRGGGDGVVTDRIPDNTLVVRGGADITPDSIVKGTGTHPSGVTGFSVESKAGACLASLCKNIRNNQVGVTTAGDIRARGGDVLSTSGRSANHATVTGLDSKDASSLLSPSVKNPVPKADRN